MRKLRANLLQFLGAVGVVVCVVLFVREPSFPTPDKIVIFLTFVFMTISQAKEMLKRLLPFVVLLLVYDSFRGIADHLNGHVDYSLAPGFDRLVFGNLPTVYLQNWLWHGHTVWYDYVLYLPYMLHFVLPVALALLVWKLREKEYWRVVTTYLVVSFGAFLTFLAMPTAPPWLASQNHHIQHIERISGDVWYGLGLKNFPSFYEKISPNPVAAVPSLHSAWSILFALFIYKLFGRRWGLLACLYPFVIIFGVIYEGEHYAFDVIVGALYAVGAYLVAPWVLAQVHKLGASLNSKLPRRTVK